MNREEAQEVLETYFGDDGLASPAPDAVPGLGTIHPQELAAWLNAEPPVLAYPHDRERSVVSAIRAAGYKPGQPGEWVREDVKK